jgi:hypothetical protein
VVVLVFDGWDQADLAVEASVVEPVDVFDDGDLEVGDGFPWASVADHLAFEERVERLGKGIVVWVAARADGGDDASVGEASRVANSSLGGNWADDDPYVTHHRHEC